MYDSSYGPGYSATATTEVAITVGPRPFQGGRGVVYAHGATQTAVDVAQNVYTRPDLFGVAGLPFIAADLAGGAGWAGATFKARVDDAWAYLQSQVKARPDKALLFGGSMGTLGCLRWALDNPTKVAAIALVLPIVNMADVHDNNRGGYASAIEAAQGVSGTYAGNATITARDPIQNTAAYSGIPIRMWYSTSDTIGQPADALSFAASVGASTVSLGAVGHTPGPFLVQDAVDFLKAYA